MDPTIFRQLTDTGLGLGSLILLTYIVLNQNKTIRNQNDILLALNKTFSENTSATLKLSDKIDQQLQNDQQLLQNGGYCKMKVQHI